jgi:hypothetical protein
MKPCSYCGRENEAAALRCAECGKEFEAEPAEAIDPALTDPTNELKVVATFGDLVHATMFRDQLEGAGIDACIPEELASSPFGGLLPLASFSVRVAARDYPAAREMLDSQNPPPLPTEQN